MIKIDIIPERLNHNEELTKAKCISYIKSIKENIKNVRANVYGIFFGPKKLRFAFTLATSTLLFAYLFDNVFLIKLTIFEIIGYIAFATLISEYLSKKLKQGLLQELHFLQKKLSTLNS